MAALIWATNGRRTQQISGDALNWCDVNRGLSFKGDRIVALVIQSVSAIVFGFW